MTVHSPVKEMTSTHKLTNKHLIDEQLWDRLVNRIAKDESMERPLAERIMDQALAFLVLCADDRKVDYKPSPLVDIGWHTFILYTKAYKDFCEMRGGFIHHEPSDALGVEYSRGDTTFTIEAMKTRGMMVDAALWTGLVHCEAGCCSSS